MYAPGIVLDAATASSADTAYREISKLDKTIAGVIENAKMASLWVRDKENNTVGWDSLSTAGDIGAEVKGLILRRLYEKRAVHQRKLAQLGFSCIAAPVAVSSHNSTEGK